MMGHSDVTALITALVIGLTGATLAASAAAQTAPAQTAGKAEARNNDAAKHATRSRGKQAKAAPEPVIAAADATQLSAAERVFTGSSACEFDQTISLEPSTKHMGYMDLRHGKKTWLMRPVLSPTGAVRLEDVKSETLLIQIGSKTMLLNQKTGQRIVDECHHPKQLAGG